MADNQLSQVRVDNPLSLDIRTTPTDPRYTYSVNPWLAHFADPIPAFRILRVGSPAEDAAAG